MRASYRVLTPQERAAINADEVAAKNSAAMEELISLYMDGAIEVGCDEMPRQAGDVAMPPMRGKELHSISHEPDNSHLTSKPCA